MMMLSKKDSLNRKSLCQEKTWKRFQPLVIGHPSQFSFVQEHSPCRWEKWWYDWRWLRSFFEHQKTHTNLHNFRECSTVLVSHCSPSPLEAPKLDCQNIHVKVSVPRRNCGQLIDSRIEWPPWTRGQGSRPCTCEHRGTIPSRCVSGLKREREGPQQKDWKRNSPKYCIITTYPQRIHKVISENVVVIDRNNLNHFQQSRDRVNGFASHSTFFLFKRQHCDQIGNESISDQMRSHTLGALHQSDQHFQSNQLTMQMLETTQGRCYNMQQYRHSFWTLLLNLWEKCFQLFGQKQHAWIRRHFGHCHSYSVQGIEIGREECSFQVKQNMTSCLSIHRIQIGQVGDDRL